MICTGLCAALQALGVVTGRFNQWLDLHQWAIWGPLAVGLAYTLGYFMGARSADATLETLHTRMAEQREFYGRMLTNRPK